MTIHQSTGTAYIVECHSHWQDDYGVDRLGIVRSPGVAVKLVGESMDGMTGYDKKYHEWVITRINLKGAKTVIHEVALKHTEGDFTISKDMWKEVP